MAFTPPKGVRPPQLEGKRTGRPKGSRNLAPAWRAAVWGFEHADDDVAPPNAAAALWQDFAGLCPVEMEFWLEEHGQL